MSPRTGRPKIQNPKATKLTVRLTDEYCEKLEKYCKQENIDKAAALRRGIDKLEIKE